MIYISSEYHNFSYFLAWVQWNQTMTFCPLALFLLIKYMAPTPEIIVLRINIPSLKVQKALRLNSSDYIWSLKKQVEEKVAAEIKDILNYGLYLHGKDGKKGKYLDERNTVGSYHLDQTVTNFRLSIQSQIDFLLKSRIGGEIPDNKKQKKMMEDIKNGNMDKLKERTQKNTDFNFVVDGGILKRYLIDRNTYYCGHYE